MKKPSKAWGLSIIAVLTVLALLAGCARQPQEIKSSAGAFTNPVYVGGKEKLPEAPDPFTLKYNGEYYTYVTGDPCLVLKSDDLVHWKLIGPMMSGQPNCWAPSVTYKNGTFYAYAATVAPGFAEQSRRVRLFTSQSPAGPFVEQATVTERYSYDPEYFMDDNGQEYLYWTEECTKLPVSCAGNAAVVDRLVSMDKLSGNMTRVAEPNITGWECKSRCILEAPAAMKRDGYYYVQYSGAAYENDTYGGGYVRAQTPMGPGGVNDTSFTKVAQVLKSVEAKVSGPGGASWVKAPNGIEDWTIYHGRGITPETMDRWLRIDPVMWGTDQFWLPGAPSYESEPAPGLPAFRDLFNGADQSGLGKDWQTTGGQWAVAGGQARQGADAGGTARALVSKAAATDYAVEGSVRLLPGAGGEAGLYVYYADDQNYATAMLDRATGALTVQAVVGGKAQEAVKFPAAGAFNPAVYHLLQARKNGDRFDFRVDGRPVGSAVFGFKAPGRIGLVTDGTGAEFDGVSMGHGWEDFFVDQTLAWGAAADGTQAAGEWRVQDGALVQGSAGGEAHAFRGSRDWGSYEVTASVQPAVAPGAGARYGLYAAYYDQKNHAEVVIDPQAGALLTHAVVGGKEQPWQSSALKESFKQPLDFSAYHTLRVVKNGFAFTFYLDGQQVQARTINLPKGQPGLLTVGAQARFDSIQAVRWD